MAGIGAVERLVAEREVRNDVALDGRLQNARRVRDVLEASAMRTLSAATAAEGLELARRHRPDLVLMDLRLPDLDGLEGERRLMYVASTRARKRLYLSFSQTRMLHGQTRYNIKSRFFDELEDNMSTEDAELTLRAVIGWGRYAEVFAYDDDSGTFSLENPT